MTSVKKTAAFALTALTLATAALASTGAEARPRHWGLGAAVIGGLAVGGLIAASNRAYAGPVYEEEAPVRRCALVERLNRFGEVVVRRVCRTEY
ncbi:hypothetical protein MCEMSEM23_02675 [Rhabdaerophilaceae bacterium]